MHKSLRFPLAICAVLLVTASASACSSPGTNSSTGSTGTSSTGTSSTSASASSSASTTAAASGAASAPAGTPVKIGVVAAETGGLAPQYGADGLIAQAWASWVNASGGIGGHPVQIINIDSKSDPATYVAAVKTLVGDKVAAILSADDYAEGSGGSYMQSTGVPVIGASGTDSALWGALPNYFQVATGFPYSVTALAQIAKGLGDNSIATVVCAEVANCLAAGTIVKGASAKLGLTYRGTLTAAQAAPNYTAQCVALTQDKAQLLVTAIAAPVTLRLGPECKQQGFTGVVAPSTESFVQAQDAQLGLTVATDLQAFPWWVDAPPVVQFRDAMAKYEPSVDYRSGDATSVWASLELFRYAVGNQGSDLTAATVLADLGKVKNATLDGLLPEPFTFAPGKSGPTVHCYWPIVLKPGATNPTVLHIGTSGNGASGDLSSSCAPPAS